MGTTTKYALRFPELADPPLVQQDIKNLANDADSKLLGLDGSGNLPLPSASKIIWNADTNLYRSAAQVLKTDTSFMAGAGAWFAQTGLTSVALGIYEASATKDSWEVLANGQLQWGPGGSTAPGDTVLYRANANILQTDDTIGIAAQTAGDVAIFSVATGDTNWRWYMLKNGEMWWGPGNAASDTRFWRSGANALSTTAFASFQGGALVGST